MTALVFTLSSALSSAITGLGVILVVRGVVELLMKRRPDEHDPRNR